MVDGEAAPFYYARPFKFQDSGLVVPPGKHLEEEVEGGLPSDKIKIGCDFPSK